MILEDQYLGGNDPFEGDLKLWLRSLPEGAYIISAVMTLEAARVAGSSEPFKETFVFAPLEPSKGQLSAENWGILKIQPASPVTFIEINFHARRMLSEVTGSGGWSTLKIDMGGTYVGIADDDTIMAPGKNNKKVILALNDRSPLPGLIVNKFELVRDVDNSSDLKIDSVSIRSVPTNLSLRLGDMPPFWTFIGEMATTKTSTDFSSLLNAFLAKASVEGGFYLVPIAIHSDAISRLNVSIRVEYQIQQSILPSYLPEATIPYGYSSLPAVDESILTVRIPRGAVPSAGTGGRLQGAFDASRVVLGSIGESGASTAVEVSPDRSLAQPIQVEEETPVSSIDLPLGRTEPGLAGLNLALQDDADGKPSGKVLIGADISVEKPVPGGPVWGNAKLPSKFRFLSGKRYWLTLQSLSGSAYWEAVRGSDAMALQASSDGGFSWHTAATESGDRPVQAILRLRHAPGKFSIPVQLQIGDGPNAKRVSFERFAPLGRVEFDADFSKELGEYLAGPGAMRKCGRDELLVNGGFEEPPHDDATYRLFGFGQATEWSPNCAEVQGNANLDRGIDLRVQRFIRIAINYGKPTRINCAGKVPARTRPDEIVSAINKALGPGVAKYNKFPLRIGESYYLRPGLTVTTLNQPGGDNGSSVEIFRWCSSHVPDGWKVDVGRIVRMKNDKERLSENVFAVLIALSAHEAGLDQICSDRSLQDSDPQEPTILSQDVAVSGGCTYILRFVFWTTDSNRMKEITGNSDSIDSKLPSWEVQWQDKDGQSLGIQSSEIDVLGQSINDYGRRRFEIRLSAPSGAVRAVVRLIQPPPGILGIDDVSFKPTLEALENGSFMQRELQDELLSLPGWTHLSGWIESLMALGVDLISTELEDAVLAQTVEVKPGERYIMSIVARPAISGNVEAMSIEKRARAELQWLADGISIGSPVIMPLDGRDFTRHFWAGDAVAGATKAEVRLIQPKTQPGATQKDSDRLKVELVSLERSDLLSVPFIFLAEAPGELKVSNLRLIYDMPVS